jgi:NAD(P)-dependent dehydrogenase (short-subunit alcohol dehydrogenase family)
MDPRDRTALVTGGAVRVGRAISLALARAGAKVIVHHHHSSLEAAELVDEIRAAGGQADTIQADLGSMDGVRDLIAAASHPFGSIDILVNNASIFPAEGFGEVDEELWERTLAVNLRAPFFLTQSLGLEMKRRGSGVVINLGDLAGLQAWTGYAAHSISKAGILHLTRVAARALAPEVRVAAIAPGTVLPPTDTSDEEIDALAKRAPLQRIGSPDDVVEALLYLIRSDFVTGEVVVVDGGRILR